MLAHPPAAGSICRKDDRWAAFRLPSARRVLLWGLGAATAALAKDAWQAGTTGKPAGRDPAAAGRGSLAGRGAGRQLAPNAEGYDVSPYLPLLPAYRRCRKRDVLSTTTDQDDQVGGNT